MKRLFVIPLMLVGIAFGQEGETGETGDSKLQADRPTVTVSPHTIPVGSYQFELGYTYTDDDGDGRRGGVDTSWQSTPQTLFRTGLSNNSELRIGWGGYNFMDEGEDVAQDMSLGLKWVFAEQDGWKPRMGVLAELSLPTGRESGDDFDPSIALLLSYDINDLTTVSGNIGIASVSYVGADGDDDFTQSRMSLAVTRTLTDDIDVFVEYFNNMPDADDEDCAHSAQVGVTYLLKENLRFDAFIGGGLNDQADDFFTGFGIVYSF